MLFTLISVPENCYVSLVFKTLDYRHSVTQALSCGLCGS